MAPKAAKEVIEEGQEHVPNNILVTGGAGFIASAFVLRMVDKYPAYKVVVLDKLDYCASRKHLQHLDRLRNFKFVKGDVEQADLVNYLLETEEIDTILHFAAQTHVDNSFGNSVIFTTNNVLGNRLTRSHALARGSGQCERDGLMEAVCMMGGAGGRGTGHGPGTRPLSGEQPASEGGGRAERGARGEGGEDGRVG
jgi:hypothetical protein